jgi:hypothetical protein
VLVPIAVFAHAVFPADFSAPPGACEVPAHLRTVAQSEVLKGALRGMLRHPPVMPTCTYCANSVTSPLVTESGHVFCRECVLARVQRANSKECPNGTDSVLGHGLPKSQLTFSELASADAAAAAALPTKLAKTMEIIRGELDADESAKFLVITAFPSVAARLERAVAAAGLGCVVVDVWSSTSTLAQRAARVATLQDAASPSEQQCIVHSRVRDAALTLTAANHLILVDPSPDIDTDMQLLASVQQPGQARSLVVHRLLVENTIEVPLHQWVHDGTVSLAAGDSDAAYQRVARAILELAFHPDAPPAPARPPALAQPPPPAPARRGAPRRR